MRIINFLLIYVAMSMTFTACNDIEIASPPGPDGKSAYEVWVEAVNDGTIEWNSGTDMPNFFKYLKGEKGENGEAGLSAYELWKEYIAAGTVDDPHNPGEKWDPNNNSQPNFYYFLTGANGDDGLTPTINDKGNWQIGEVDTGIKAKGEDGEDGDKVEIIDGYWYINGENTDIPSTGPQGEPGEQGPAGADGTSAYAIWVSEVLLGHVTDKDNQEWDHTLISLEDFMNYMKGEDGVNPDDMERTKLEYYSSSDDADNQTFIFHTDPNAVVTMNYEDITISRSADDSGVCEISFPRGEHDRAVIVYSNHDSQIVSFPLTVTVYAKDTGHQPGAAINYDFAGVKWYGSDGHELDNSTGDYGEYDNSGNIPYISFYTVTDRVYITIPFNSHGIIDIVVVDVGGYNQLNVTTELQSPDDYSEGFLKIGLAGFVLTPGTANFIFMAITEDGASLINRVNVEVIY